MRSAFSWQGWGGVLGMCAAINPAWAIYPLDDAELNTRYYSSEISPAMLDQLKVVNLSELKAPEAVGTVESIETSQSGSGYGLRTLLVMDLHHSQSVDYSEATFSDTVIGEDGRPRSMPSAAVRSNGESAGTLAAPSEMIKKVSALIAASMPAPDTSLTQNLLSWQLQQQSSPTGKQAQSQVLFGDIMLDQLGSERYSTRWAGNLQDVLIVQTDPSLNSAVLRDVLGNDVEMRMSGNTIRILELKYHTTRGN